MNLPRLGKRLLWLIALAVCNAQEVTDDPLRTIESIHTQPAELIEQGQPVEIVGIVSCCTTNGLYINGGGRCIYIDWEQAEANGGRSGARPPEEDMKLGDAARVWGTTAPGNYSPKIMPVSYRKLRTSELSNARVIQLDHLLSGNVDGQWVSLDRVIQEAALRCRHRRRPRRGALWTSGHAGAREAPGGRTGDHQCARQWKLHRSPTDEHGDPM